MSNWQRLSGYVSPKATERVVSKLSPRRSPPMMRNSPSLAEINAKHIEQDSSFRSPVISDLQSAYAKALNSIDFLKAEKTQMKNTIRVLLSKRNGGSGNTEETDRSQAVQNLTSSRSLTSRNLESNIRELESERASLQSRLESERARYSELKKKYETAQEKLAKFDEISALNAQTQAEMSKLSSDLLEINKLVLHLEEEKRQREQPPSYNEEIEDCMKYIEHMLRLLENLDTTHYAKIFFNERFKSELNILYDIQQQNQSKLLLKSFKYITDILINIIPHNSKIQILAHRPSKGSENFIGQSESFKRASQIPKLDLLHSLRQLRKSPSNEELETSVTENSSRGVFNDNSTSYNKLSNVSVSKVNASENLKQRIRQKIEGSQAAVSEGFQTFSGHANNIVSLPTEQVQSPFRFDQMTNYDSNRRSSEYFQFKDEIIPGASSQNDAHNRQRNVIAPKNSYSEIEVKRRQSNKLEAIPIRYSKDRGTEQDRLESKSWLSHQSQQELSYATEAEIPYAQMHPQRGYLFQSNPMNFSENKRIESPGDGFQGSFNFEALTRPKNQYSSQHSQIAQSQESIEEKYTPQSPEKRAHLMNRQFQLQTQYDYLPDRTQVPSDQASWDQTIVQALDQLQHESYSSLQGQETYYNFSRGGPPHHPSPSNKMHKYFFPQDNKQLPMEQSKVQQQKSISKSATWLLEGQDEEAYSDLVGGQAHSNNQFTMIPSVNLRQKESFTSAFPKEQKLNSPQHRNIQESTQIQKNRGSSALMLPTIDEQNHLSDENHEHRASKDELKYQPAQTQDRKNKTASQEYFQSQRAPEGLRTTKIPQSTLQSQVPPQFKEEVGRTDFFEGVENDTTEPFIPNISEKPLQSQGSKQEGLSIHFSELETARYKTKMKKTEAVQASEKGATLENQRNPPGKFLPQELILPVNLPQEVTEEQRPNSVIDLDLHRGSGSLSKAHESVVQSQDTTPQNQRKQNVSIRPIKTSSILDRSKSQEESSRSNSSQRASTFRNPHNLAESPRLSRFNTSFLVRKSSTFDKNSPLNTSRETGASKKNRELSFQISFGKTLSLDPTDKINRFEAIHSDRVSIDSLARKKRIAHNSRDFNIISGKPQEGKPTTVMSPMGRTDSPNIIPSSGSSLTKPNAES